MIILTLSILLGLYIFKKSSKAQKIFTAFLGITLTIELPNFIYLNFLKEKSPYLKLYDNYSYIEFIFLSLFFFQIIKNKLLKQSLLFVTPLGLIFIYIIQEHLLMPNFNAILFTQTVFILFSITYLLQCLDSNIDLFKLPEFWIVTGILFFNACFFFLSGLISFISSKDVKLATSLFKINHLLNIIYYSLITYGFICQARLAKRS